MADEPKVQTAVIVQNLVLAVVWMLGVCVTAPLLVVTLYCGESRKLQDSHDASSERIAITRQEELETLAKYQRVEADAAHEKAKGVTTEVFAKREIEIARIKAEERSLKEKEATELARITSEKERLEDEREIAATAATDRREKQAEFDQLRIPVLQAEADAKKQAEINRADEIRNEAVARTQQFEAETSQRTEESKLRQQQHELTIKRIEAETNEKRSLREHEEKLAQIAADQKKVELTLEIARLALKTAELTAKAEEYRTKRQSADKAAWLHEVAGRKIELEIEKKKLGP